MSMYIFAMVAGLERFATGVRVEPFDTIATLLQRMAEKFARRKMPHEFTGAYSLVHTHPVGLREDDPDNIALEQGDPVVTAKYLTPAARLDPTKTVHDYFGDKITSGTASFVVTWPPQALALVKQQRERQAIAWKREQEMAAIGPHESNMTDGDEETETESTPAAVSPWTPWRWLTSAGTADAADDAKKND